MFKGVGCFPNERKLALYNKGTVRTVTQVIVRLQNLLPDEVSGRVYVLNMIYAKRDQLKAINKMNLYD